MSVSSEYLLSQHTYYKESFGFFFKKPAHVLSKRLKSRYYNGV